tara:strand:+ start:378 stop:635 length:258 start_codon:yes stop_codon:yes gene_type:complete
MGKSKSTYVHDINALYGKDTEISMKYGSDNEIVFEIKSFWDWLPSIIEVAVDQKKLQGFYDKEEFGRAIDKIDDFLNYSDPENNS